MHVYYIALVITLILAKFCTCQYYKEDGPIVFRIENWGTMFLVLLPLVAVIAFRWNVGVDSYYGASYSTAYHDAAKGINSREFEIGYFKLSQFFSCLKVPFFWFLFVQAIIFMLCIAKGISRGSVYPLWSIIVLVGVLVFFDGFSALRQALAEGIAIMALGIFFDEEKTIQREIKFAAMVCVAMLFHKIAFLYVVIMAICRKKYDKTSLLLIMIAGTLASPVIQIILSLAMRIFAGQYTTLGFGSSYTLFSLVVCSLCYLLYEEICEISENAYIGVNLSILIFILMLNSSALVLPFRMFDALKICYVFIIPMVIRGCRGVTKRVLVGGILGVIIAVWFINAAYIQSSSFANYQSVFADWGVYSRIY